VGDPEDDKGVKMRKIALLVLCTFLFSYASAFEYYCYLQGDRRTIICDIPLEPYWEKMVNTYERIVDVYKKLIKVEKDVNMRIKVLGTEYWQGEQITLWVQLVNGSLPINNQLCILDAYNPFGEVLEEEVVMDYINGSKGMYKYTSPIDTSNMSGNYIYNVVCYTGIHKFTVYPISYNVTKGVLISGTINDTYTSDNKRLVIEEEEINGSYTVEVVYNFNFTFIGNMTSNTYFMEYIWSRKTGAEVEDLNVYLYNYNISDWELIDTVIGTTSDSDASRLVSDDKYTKDGLLRLKVNDTMPYNDTDKGSFEIDLLKVDFVETTPEIKTIIGGGEVHVHEPELTANTEEFVKYLLSVGSLQLISNHDYCMDNQTLVKELTYQYCIDSKCFNTTRIEYVNCTYGCDLNTNSCYPSPAQQFLILFGLFVIFMVVLWLLAKL